MVQFLNTIVGVEGISGIGAGRILKIFPAFKYRNYRFYFLGQLVSLIGTWLQTVAQGWLVFQMTHSAFWVGFVATLETLPIFFLSLPAGVIVDRFPKKTILLFTQAASMVLALLLGFLTLFSLINLVQICILAFLAGAVKALDAPARQSFAIELVGREDLPSAIALNAGIYNSARVIGPAVAGILISVIGVGWTFIINGISYVAVLVALYYMSIEHMVHKSETRVFQSLIEGVRYSFSHPKIRLLLLFTAATAIFGWSYITLMPVVAETVFGLGSGGLGLLYSTAGLGAVCGMVLVSAFSRKIHENLYILGGNLFFSVSLFLFTLSSNLFVASVFLFLSGMGLILQFSMINNSIQHSVPDYIRGRVMSLYVLMFLGMAPFGSFQIGYLAEQFGSQMAMRIGALVLLLIFVVVFLQREKLRESANVH